jgi:hypothetical protein
MKRVFSLFLFVATCSFSLQAQTLYEIDYHFQLKEGKETYKALMLRNQDGSGIIRLEYYDLKTKSRNLVEMMMEEHYGIDEKGKEDTTLLIFVGLDQRQIIGEVLYKPDNFVFQLSPDGFYEPAFVLSLNDDNTEDIGVLDNVKLLNREDLSEETVLKYFTKEEEFYTNLFEATTRGLTAEEKRTKLHLILIANTNDKKIGKACAVDKEATHNTFGEMAEFLGIQYVPTIIEGASFSKANVDKALAALKPGANDIVVFYYSGHGFNDIKEPNNYPFMDLRDKSFQAFGAPYTINMETVFNQIKAKGARLNLVLSDCCNNDPSQTTNITAETPSTRTSSLGWDKNKCLSLFMNPKKMSVLMSAAQKGELSAGNGQDGGFFTFNFRESLEKKIGLFDKGKDVSWAAILVAAKTQTIARADRTKCRMPDDSWKTCVQHPVFIME